VAYELHRYLRLPAGQLGVRSTDVVMPVMNKRRFDGLLMDKFRIGAEALAAAGDLQRDSGRHNAGSRQRPRADSRAGEVRPPEPHRSRSARNQL